MKFNESKEVNRYYVPQFIEQLNKTTVVVVSTPSVRITYHNNIDIQRSGLFDACFVLFFSTLFHSGIPSQ